MTPPIRATLCALSATLLPALAAAEDLGRVTAFVDGQERTWYTVAVDRRAGKTYTAGVLLGPRLTEVQVQAHAEPRFTIEDIFTLDIRYASPFVPGAEPVSVDIMVMPGGMGGPFWTTKGLRNRPRVDILTLDIWGSAGRLEAVFEGQLCLRPKISAATDPDNCRAVSGFVDTRLFAE